MFKTKMENHPPQILPSLEHHCSCILLFLSKAHLICSVWDASQGYADPTGHSEVPLFPEYLKSKAPQPFRLSSYTQQNKTFPLCLALNKSKLGICLLLQSSVGSQSSWGPELVCSYSDTSRWSSPRCVVSESFEGWYLLHFLRCELIRPLQVFTFLDLHEVNAFYSKHKS